MERSRMIVRLAHWTLGKNMKSFKFTLIVLLSTAFLGCSREPQKSPHLPFYRIATQSSDVTRSVSLNGERIYLIEPPAITSPMIEDASSSQDDHGRPYILIKFAEPTISDFAALSKASVGERLAIVISGELVAAPVLREPILNGVMTVGGPFLPTKARDITYTILGLDSQK